MTRPRTLRGLSCGLWTVSLVVGVVSLPFAPVAGCVALLPVGVALVWLTVRRRGWHA